MLRKTKMNEIRIRWDRQQQEARREAIQKMDCLREQGHIVYLGRDLATLGDTIKVLCDHGCGNFVQILWGIPQPFTCQICYLKRKEGAGV